MKTTAFKKSDVSTIQTGTGSHYMAVIRDGEEHREVIRRGKYNKVGQIWQCMSSDSDGNETILVAWDHESGGRDLVYERIDQLRLVVDV